MSSLSRLVNVSYRSNKDHSLNIEKSVNKYGDDVFLPTCSCGWFGNVFDTTSVINFIDDDVVLNVAKKYGVGQVNYFNNSQNNSSLKDMMVTVKSSDQASRMALKQALEHIGYDKDVDLSLIKSRISFYSNSIDADDSEAVSQHKLRSLVSSLKDLDAARERGNVWDNISVGKVDKPNSLAQKILLNNIG